MKDQYVGDIGDYGKYSLLKAFADAGVKVGVNWYYTNNDGTEDGKFTKYLSQPEKFRRYCPEVFDVLKDIVENNKRNISEIESAEIVPGACYHNKSMELSGSPTERKEEREKWFQDSKIVLDSADLIYFDPDNGLLTNNAAGASKTAIKYAFPKEIEEYYNSGKNVVYYCHKGRRGKDEWEKYKSAMLYLSDVRQIVLTYHKGTQRSFVFLIHSEDYENYRRILEELTLTWEGLFKKE